MAFRTMQNSLFGIIFILLSVNVCCQETVRAKRSTVISQSAVLQIGKEKAKYHACEKIQYQHGRPMFCQDKMEMIPGHTMCLASPRDRHAVNGSDKTVILGKINTIRHNVKPTASNMSKMKWITVLQLEAQIWAEQCQLKHDDDYRRYIPGRYVVGQNMAMKIGFPMSWAEIIDLWSNESLAFVYNGSGNKVQDVGNYTQLVWAETIAVGCGYANCSNIWFYVCNFAPGSNAIDISKPYKNGSMCDDCPLHCNKSLTEKFCDCKGVFCINGASLNMTTCKCDCLNGVNVYTGDFCELHCIKGGDDKGCPATNASCMTNSSLSFSCPWLCGVCPYAGKNYSEGSVLMPWETLPTPTPTTPTTTTTGITVIVKTKHGTVKRNVSRCIGANLWVIAACSLQVLLLLRL